MTKPGMTPKTFFNTLTVLHLAFFGSMLGFAIVSYVLVKNHTLDLETIETIFLMVVLFLTLLGVFGGSLIKKNVLATANSKKSLREKLAVYQTACIIRYATLEGPALFAIVSYILTEQFFFLLIALAIMFFFFSLKPNKSKISKELKLSRDHQLEFNRENQELI